MVLFKIVKIRDFPIFQCFEFNSNLYLRSAFIYNRSLQTVYVGISMKHFKLFLGFGSLSKNEVLGFENAMTSLKFELMLLQQAILTSHL